MSSAEEIFLKDVAFKSDLVRTSSGDLDIIAGLENIKDALLRRLSTTPGSIVHRPDFGVGIKDFQNGINSLSQQQKLALRIQEEFEQDERVEKVLGVKVVKDDYSPEKLTIIVRVKLVGYGEQMLDFVPFEGI